MAAEAGAAPPQSEVVFLKLGGSLLTDKAAVELVRSDVLARIAAEIAGARAARPSLRLVLGHGSGSFGHVAAARHGTRDGVSSAEGWLGLAEVSDAAARLNRIVVAALLAAGVPALSLQPSASAVCAAGRLVELAAKPVRMALAAGLVPVVYGDVAFDLEWGGTIISTEEIMAYLAAELAPQWLLLAGEVDGVLAAGGETIPLITPEALPDLEEALGGSRGTDVTGGMVTKVKGMAALAAERPALAVRIFSGLVAGNVERLLLQPGLPVGTAIVGAAS